jgi:predicted RNase H-like HicB family nuclease
LRERHHINVFWSAEDECWIADVPDLEFCSAHGASPAEAVARVEEAVAAWLEVAREQGKAIPNPRYQPPEVMTG